MNIRFVADRPVIDESEDLLDYKIFAEKIKTAIYKTPPPFVYGLFGDWGTGKTSILKMVEKLLNKEVDEPTEDILYVPIWFDVWEYENEISVMYPLLHMIKKSHKQRLGQHLSETSFVEKSKTFGKAMVLTGADGLLRATTKKVFGEAIKLADVTSSLASLEDFGSQVEGILSTYVNTVEQIKKDFSSLLTSYAEDLSKLPVIQKAKIEKHNIKFVILIDDLDRCLPETTITILEGIKNYLSVEQAIFFLGINHKVIFKAIKWKYNGMDINGRDYLEKIINMPFSVPIPSTQLISKFAKKMINEQVRALTDYGTLWQPHIDTVINVFGQVGLSAPRKIKRILNNCILFIDTYRDTLNNYHIEDVTKLLIIADYFPEFFALLSTQQSKLEARLNDIGKLDVNQLVQEFGLNMSDRYADIFKMISLFNFHPSPPDNATPGLHYRLELFKGVFNIVKP